jgi:uncharacterized damage-inducible protein DinB
MVFRNNPEVCCLADQLERSFRGGAWHGPAIREALMNIDATTAERRPGDSPHTIVEHIRHITFWLNAAYQRIIGETEVDPEADWLEEEKMTEKAWTQVIADLEKAHTKLYTALLDLDDDRLDEALVGIDPTVRGLLLGVLQHNAYHTGQIIQIARELAI